MSIRNEEREPDQPNAGDGERRIASIVRRIAGAALMAMVVSAGVAAAVTSGDGGVAALKQFGSEGSAVAVSKEASTTVEAVLVEVEVDPSDGLDEEELAVLCDSAGNHGEYVSAVARAPLAEAEERSHGAVVSEAAQTDCGRSGEEEVEEAADATEIAEVEVEVDPSDGLDEEELAVLCDSAGNHGEYVSAVARAPLAEAEERSHGEVVSESAQTDCGKSGEDGSDDGEPADVTASEVDDTPSAKAGKGGPPPGRGGPPDGKGGPPPGKGPNR